MKQKGIAALPVLIVIILLAAVGYLILQNTQLKRGNSANDLTGSVPTNSVSKPTPTIDPTSNWKAITFEKINLNLKVPENFSVHTEEPNPGDFVAFIQNYEFNTPFPEENAYQLYMIRQNGIVMTPEDFQNLKNDLEPTSIEETTISGYPAIKGQYKGLRNRFVTFILLKNTNLALFTADPTPQNKILTDQILSTFKFTN